jgi:hypothetical protein
MQIPMPFSGMDLGNSFPYSGATPEPHQAVAEREMPPLHSWLVWVFRAPLVHSRLRLHAAASSHNSCLLVHIPGYYL